jgi:hypothetical protein
MVFGCSDVDFLQTRLPLLRLQRAILRQTFLNPEWRPATPATTMSFVSARNKIRAQQRSAFGKNVRQPAGGINSTLLE